MVLPPEFINCGAVKSTVAVPVVVLTVLGVVPPIAGGEARYVAKSSAAGTIALPVGCHAGTNVWPEVVGLARKEVVLLRL